MFTFNGKSKGLECDGGDRKEKKQKRMVELPHGKLDCKGRIDAALVGATAGKSRVT